MFTGLVKELGMITQVQENLSGKLFHIFSTELIKEMAVDDSVAINGVCLTVTKIHQDVFEAQAVPVTLEKTTLGELQQGDKVNLELALRFSDRLGGHLVQGHVEGKGEISRIDHQRDNHLVCVKLPAELYRFILKEGSITLDGISLTVAYMRTNEIAVSVIPHTWSKTNLAYKKVGNFLNVEVDVLAKYVDRLLGSQKHQGNYERFSV